jgi:hypothetical protein
MRIDIDMTSALYEPRYVAGDGPLYESRFTDQCSASIQSRDGQVYESAAGAVEQAFYLTGKAFDTAPLLGLLASDVQSGESLLV